MSRKPTFPGLTPSVPDKPLLSFLKPPTVEFDGHRFEVGPGVATIIPLVHLAQKARRGDVDATAILAAFQVLIKDATGKLYWPVPGIVQSEQPTAPEPDEIAPLTLPEI